MKRSTLTLFVVAVLLGTGMLATASASAGHDDYRDQRQSRYGDRGHRDGRLGPNDGQPPNFRVTIDSRGNRDHYRQDRYRSQPVCPPPQPRYHRQWVPGHFALRHCPPVYRTYYQACGTPRRVLVSQGRYERIWVPGRWVTTRY